MQTSGDVVATNRSRRPGWDTDDRETVCDVPDHRGAGTDAHVVTQTNGFAYDRPGADEDTVTADHAAAHGRARHDAGVVAQTGVVPNRSQIRHEPV